jgi:hypothetical protein
MIFGRTFDEKCVTRWWFAWYPVQLGDGRYAWGRMVWAVWSHPMRSVGSWRYYEKPS